MTCIAAVAQGGKVWMAADSAATNDYTSFQSADAKVFVLGEMLIGVAGEARIRQLLRFGMRSLPPTEGADSDLDWLVSTFVPAVRACLRAGGMLHVESGLENLGTETCLLLGYRGRIYRVHRDFDVLPLADSYGAAGCALEYALGSLHATGQYFASRVEDPEKRVVMAVQAAAYHGRAVREPITVECVG